ncbi:MAG: hypothetical protein QMD09_03440 [Desulfatibacillaceae bacterium]|nr:hypothetical protein [Desulfatibacillaceae bacterium]
MRQLFNILLFSAAFLFWACPALAQGTGLSLTMTTQADANRLTVTVLAKNSGTKALFNLAPVLEIPKQAIKTAPLAALEPGASHSFIFFLSRARIPGPGRYTAIFKIKYEDGKKNSYCAVHGGLFATKPSLETDIKISAGDVLVDGRTILSLMIENSGQRARDLEIELVAPCGLIVEKPRRMALFMPGQQAEFEFALSNQSWPPSSKLPVFAVVRFNEDYTANAAMAKAMVSVADRYEPWFMRLTKLWLILAISLCVFAIIHGVVLARKRRAAKKALKVF